MERGVKNSHLRHVRQSLLDSINTLEVSGVMKRRQLHALYDFFLHLRRNEHRLIEFLSTMDYAMTDCVNLLKVFDDADFCVHQHIENEFDTDGVFGH